MGFDRAKTSRAVLVALLAISVATPAMGVAGKASRDTASAALTPRVAAVGSAHARNPRRNPRHNLAPKPNYQPVCFARGYHDSQCVKQELAAIRNARRHEHLKRPQLILPRNFTHLTTAEQVFVVTNLERVGRGLRPFRGLTQQLSAIARASAKSNTDPMLATRTMRALHIYEYGSIWASDLGPLGADYDWMYNDGYGNAGINIACPTPSAQGCWGHRQNILGGYGHLPTLLAGAGTSTPAGRSISEVLAGSNGKTPKLTYTWKKALAHGANRRHVNHHTKRYAKHHRKRHAKH
jgi:hypothetical protein